MSEQKYEDTPNLAKSQDDRDRPVLRLLPHDKRPVKKTACETCQHANWFATAAGLNAYCRRMFLLTWPAEPSKIIELCDGQLEPPEE